jgi:S-adenosylmethionine decarboxylase
MRSRPALAGWKMMNGIEWVVDARGCSAESLRSAALLRKLFERLIESLQLRPVAPTQWHEFPNTGGITGLCLLAESHLACHTFPEFGSMSLNLFCCTPREEWHFEAELNKLFGATSVSVRTLVRPYGNSEQNVLEPTGATAKISRESGNG